MTYQTKRQLRERAHALEIEVEVAKGYLDEAWREMAWREVETADAKERERNLKDAIEALGYKVTARVDDASRLRDIKITPKEQP